MPRLWDDPKYKSNDSFHRVWVTDLPGRVTVRQAEGYRLVMEDGKHVEMPVGFERVGVLMEIPQIKYQLMVSPPPELVPDSPDMQIERAIQGMVKPQGQPIRRWFGRRPPGYREADLFGAPIFGFLPNRKWINPWNPWRILHFPEANRPFNGLLNISRGDRWVRLVIRYHNDRYYYLRLRWRPWKLTAEKRTRFTENARLAAKYPEMEGGDDAVDRL